MIRKEYILHYFQLLKLFIEICFMTYCPLCEWFCLYLNVYSSGWSLLKMTTRSSWWHCLVLVYLIEWLVTCLFTMVTEKSVSVFTSIVRLIPCFCSQIATLCVLCRVFRWSQCNNQGVLLLHPEIKSNDLETS